MKKVDLILDAVGEVRDDYLSEIDSFLLENKRNKKKRRIGAVAGIAAMLVLVTVISFAVRIMDSWGSNANYTVDGAIGGGYFYYECPYDGIYRYEPGKTSEKIVDTKGRPWYDFVVNDDALYYTRWETGKTIYRVPHGSDSADVLFSDDDAMSVELGGPATVGRDLFVVLVYDNDKQGSGDREVIIDGQTGEIKEEIRSFFILEDKKLWESLMYSDIDIDEKYDMTHRQTSYDNPRISYTVGDRTIIAERNDDGTYDLTENGERIYGGFWTPEYMRILGDSLVFAADVTDESPDHLPIFRYLIVRPDGKDDLISLENVGKLQGNEDFIYYFNSDNDLIAFDTRTSKSSVIMQRDDLYDKEVYTYCELYSDGEYIYFFRTDERNSPINQNNPMKCYKIVYDPDGKPKSLELIDDNIND